MKPKPLKSIKREALEKVYVDLQRRYEAAYAQLLSIVDEAAKIPIHNTIKQLEQRMQATEDELSSLECCDNTPKQRYLNVSTNLYKIDFSEAIAVFKHILTQFGNKGGAALFLLQQSLSMCGDLCVTWMRNLLREETGDWKHYPVTFSVEKSLDEGGLFEGLGRHLNVPRNSTSWQQYAQQILQKLCGSVRGGSIVFIELNQWDNLAAQEHVLRRFLDLFWIPLVHQLPEITKQCRKVKFIAVIIAHGPLSLPHEVYTTLCCDTPDRFSSEKILELPLRHWTCEEIQEWLEHFSGWEAQQIDLQTSNIYNVSMDGIPKLAYEALLEKFS